MKVFAVCRSQRQFDEAFKGWVDEDDIKRVFVCVNRPDHIRGYVGNDPFEVIRIGDWWESREAREALEILERLKRDLCERRKM